MSDGSKCRSPPLTALPNLLAGFEGTLRGGEREGQREGREGRGEHTPMINFWTHVLVSYQWPFRDMIVGRTIDGLGDNLGYRLWREKPSFSTPQ